MPATLPRAVTAVAVLTASAFAIADAPSTQVADAAPSEGFLATFDTPSDFYDRFDYGFSGFHPAANGNPDRLVEWRGDHDAGCGSPNSQRTINVDRSISSERALDYSYTDFEDLFWWCRGHMMTGVNAVGYNIAWFSPKPYFEDISRVCWDINVTQTSTRKWTQVLFVSETDALAHPSAHGSHGYDLGYTNPMFRGQPGTPSAEILPVAGDLAGAQMLQSGYFSWFENQDHWTSQQNGSQSIVGVHDKAGRYQHCIEQINPTTLRFTQERPSSHGGFQQIDVPGIIPRGPVRVVFQDDNYNSPKGERYDPNALTWHWDNIVVETGERIDVPRDPAPQPGPTAVPTTRMLDTRFGSANVTADGQYQHTGKIRPGSPLEVQIAGRNGIPAGATSAFLNITATEPDGAGYLTAYPCGSQPFASTVNYTHAGHTVANLAAADLSSRGSVCIAAQTATHVVIDASEYLPPGEVTSMSPVRMADSRSGSSAVTTDGQFRNLGKVAPGRPLEIQIAGRNGVPASATSAFLNITATEPDGPGYLTVYPCGSQPFASTVNYTHAGHTVANLTLSDLSSRGTVCVASLLPTHLIIDATGYSTSSSPTSMTPVRMADSRPGSTAVTADGQFRNMGKVRPGQPLEVQIAGRNGIPAGATSAFLNITATETDGPGYLTVYPCGELPFISTVNYTHAGHTVANLAATELSGSGSVCIAAQTPTHVVIDATGY